MVSVRETRFYDLLGVTPTADENAIKKGFRQMAMKHHPDRNPGDITSADKFKEISWAYEILSDAHKRAFYDRFGEEQLLKSGFGSARGNSNTAAGGGGPFGDSQWPPPDLFSNFFGGDIFGGMGARRGRQRPRKGEDLVHALEVTLEDLYNSKHTRLALRRNVLCTDCNGHGTTKPDAVKTCDLCNGSGMQVTLRQLGIGMIQQLQTVCTKCRGQGVAISEMDRCIKCRGNKVVQEKKILDIYIDKGMMHEQKLTYGGEGDQEPDVIPGDVIIILKQLEHPVFKRDGPDLQMRHRLTLVEALCGFSFSIKHLDGRVLVVKSPPGQVIKPGDTKEIPNEGMPYHRRPLDKGNLLIQFDVVFPDHMPIEHISLLEQVLPKRPDYLPDVMQTMSSADEEFMSEAVTLQERSDTRNGRHNSHPNGFRNGASGEAYEEDEGRDGGLGCTQQ
eukprot:TRINITY_DN4270_c0_g1_i1.p1 TRINITY_DN4270_c0_g1~~TRINITY_DN4270_c0_g1_i1.p1  ORF type:complete len:446 (+),score=71.96 TRINITY_DN4270_c0_g1_i1:128-1465(+)